MDFQSVIFFGWIELSHPVMVLFGISALIPILIHYWHRNNHVRMNWAATHYLQLALQKVGRRYSILQWLLLVLRVLILLVLAVSLAAPSINNLLSSIAVESNQPTLQVLLVDQTMSMQAKSQDRSRMEEAKRIASDIVEAAKDSDGFVLYFFDDQLHPGLPLPVSDPNVVKTSIDAARASLGSGGVSDAIENLQTRLIQSDFQEFNKLQVHVISDFSISDSPVSEGESNGQQTDKSEEEQLELTRQSLLKVVDRILFYPVAENSLSNNFVSKIDSAKSVFLAGKSEGVRVEVQNRGSESDQSVAIELLVNDQIVANKQVKLSANGTTAATFQLAFERPGDQFIEARIAGDSLEPDNHRFLNIRCRQRYQVLFVEGRPGCTRFLQVALDPELGDRSKYEISTCQPADLSRQELSGYDVVVWDNLPRQNPVEIDRLKRFMKQGGQVILFLGDLIDRPQFNSNWNGDGRDPLNLQLVGLQPIDRYQLDPLDYGSRFLEAFRGNPQAGLSEIPIWTYFKVETASELNSSAPQIEPESRQDIDRERVAWNVDLALTNGDPLLVSRRFGKGALVLFASSSSSDSRVRTDPDRPEGTPWNANETVPAFPALVQEIFAGLNRLPVATETQIGDRWIDETEFRTRLILSSLSRPDGEQVESSVRQANDVVTWRSDPLRQAGVYRYLFKSAETEKTKVLAVNVSTQESNLGVGPFGRDNEMSEQEASSFLSGRVTDSSLVLQWLLGAILAMLLLESVAALRFGRSRG